MSERERWIIYPLLFFALGAAVRDKILHRVEAKEIYCESLKIVDQQDPTGRALVELSITRGIADDLSQLAHRAGSIRLADSDGYEVCQLDSNSLRIVDQRSSESPAFAELSIRHAEPNDPTQSVDRAGLLRLAGGDGQEISHMDSNSLTILDQRSAKSPAFAELSIKQARSNDPTQLADRVGLLRMVDSAGNVVCHLDHNAYLPRVISGRLDIVDAQKRLRAVATTEHVPEISLPNGDETMTTQGVIWLNNQKLGIKLSPPANQRPVPTLPPETSL